MAEGALANIDEAGKHKRLRGGMIGMDLAIVAGILMVVFAVAWYWRLALFVPFFYGVICILQARANC